MQTNAHTGTRIDEVAAGIYRINTPLNIPGIPGGFNLSQYLVVDEQPLVFHTGWRRWFPFVSEAIATVIPLDRIRHVGYSHFEGDESGAMNDFLAVAPEAVPFASQVSVMTSLNDYADRPGRGLADGEEFSTGKKQWQWLYTPHVPHGWDCGILFDKTTGTLLCGDLFTQAGAETPAVTEAEILTASEAMRKPMDYYAHSRNTRAILERLAELKPKTLACQHGSAYRGDGAALLRELAAILEKENQAG
ncbi:MAG: MBL fold metallo-hydrolase [Candidatus Hydrogenedentes bacterium]|nr:MBL fold metallo-hydrolase [Candidatus Hydrogenedentota bacterium]